MNHGTLTRLAFALALCAALSGCGGAHEEPIVSTEAPPAPLQVETVPAISDPQLQIWRPGYWVLSEHDFAWVPGKIVPRPSPTAVWSPAHWVRHDYGWSFEQGHWQ